MMGIYRKIVALDSQPTESNASALLECLASGSCFDIMMYGRTAVVLDIQAPKYNIPKRRGLVVASEDWRCSLTGLNEPPLVALALGSIKTYQRKRRHILK
jgi:hypothetical protein